MLACDLARHFSQPRQFTTHVLMVGADNMLDETAHGIACEIRGLGPRFIGCGVREFFEHLVDRELQLHASLFERFVCARTEVDIKPLKNGCCR